MGKLWKKLKIQCQESLWMEQHNKRAVFFYCQYYPCSFIVSTYPWRAQWWNLKPLAAPIFKYAHPPPFLCLCSELYLNHENNKNLRISTGVKDKDEKCTPALYWQMCCWTLVLKLHLRGCALPVTPPKQEEFPGKILGEAVRRLGEGRRSGTAELR